MNLNDSGQSTVEYILLIAVVVSIATLFFKSAQFEDMFGKNGKFSSIFKKQLEYGYMHGLPGNKGFIKPDYLGGRHDSYQGRLFGSANPYPAE